MGLFPKKIFWSLNKPMGLFPRKNGTVSHMVPILASRRNQILGLDFMGKEIKWDFIKKFENQK